MGVQCNRLCVQYVRDDHDSDRRLVDPGSDRRDRRSAALRAHLRTDGLLRAGAPRYARKLPQGERAGRRAGEHHTSVYHRCSDEFIFE